MCISISEQNARGIALRLLEGSRYRINDEDINRLTNNLTIQHSLFKKSWTLLL